MIKIIVNLLFLCIPWTVRLESMLGLPPSKAWIIVDGTLKKQADKMRRTFLTYMRVCVNMSVHSSYATPVKMADPWA